MAPKVRLAERLQPDRPSCSCPTNNARHQQAREVGKSESGSHRLPPTELLTASKKLVVLVKPGQKAMAQEEEDPKVPTLYCMGLEMGLTTVIIWI